MTREDRGKSVNLTARRPRSWLLLAALLPCLGASPALGQEDDTAVPEAETEPSCYDRAQQSSQLSGDQALKLCGASQHDGPAACFEAAARQTDLGTDDAVILCQCADSTAPVACFERGLSASMLSSDALRMCSRVYSSLFPTVCLR